MNINKVHVELDMEQVKPYKPIARARFYAVSMPPKTKDTAREQSVSAGLY